MTTSDSPKTFKEEITGSINEIINQVKKLIREGNARRVIIQDKDGKVLFQSQLTVGIGGAALLTTIAPIVSAIGMFALFMNDVKIIVERYPEEGSDDKDEYEVEAEYIEIRDEEEESEESDTNEKSTSEKTVGRDDK